MKRRPPGGSGNGYEWLARPSAPARTRSRHADDLSGLTSLRFIGAAVRRRAWLWCGAALAGVALSLGVFTLVPPAFHASASVLVANDPSQDANTQMQGNLDLAQSERVAGGVLRKLGLHQSAASFLRTYTVEAVTDQVLQITASAPSNSAAIREANALATAFVQFRAELLRTQQRLAIAEIQGRIVTAKQQVASIASEIARETVQTSGAQRKAELRRLNREKYGAGTVLGGLYFSASDYPVTTLSMIKGTRLLDGAAEVPPSRKHLAVLTAAAGFTGGLALGLGFVVVSAVATDRLRRRDEVAQALGAPVRLSVGRVPGRGWLRGWLPGRGLPGGATGRRAERLVAHLLAAIPRGEHPAALAVIAVDDSRAIASSLVTATASLARQGRRVVLADLSAGTRVARLLGLDGPGLHRAQTDGDTFLVAVPEHHAGVPAGPIRAALPLGDPGPADAALATAWESADVLLSFATLDPAIGAEHLATWSRDAIVIVTAGRSPSARIRAAGQMIRLAGLHLASAVLVSADHRDDSLGIIRPSAGWRRPTLI